MNLKKRIGFLVFITIIVVFLCYVVDANAQTQVEPLPKLPVNATDYYYYYLDLLEEYEELKELELRWLLQENRILDNNIITYYFDNKKSYQPYPMKFSYKKYFSNPHYGENSTLSQLVDNYENLNYVEANNSIVRNSTLNCMELEMGASSRIYENFSTFTEDDALNRITVFNSTHFAYNSWRDEDMMLYRDYGVNHFDDFTHEFQVYCDDIEYLALAYFYTLSNSSGKDIAQHLADDDPFLTVRYYRYSVGDGGARIIQLWNHDSLGNSQADTYSGFSEDAWYYYTLYKNDNNVTLAIYSDSARTSLVDTLSITTSQSDPKFRYFYGACGHDSSASYHYLCDIDYGAYYWFGNMSGSAYVNNGNYYTTNLLSGTNNTALSMMFNTTIPANDIITIEFSSDNSTWRNHNNQSGYDSLSEGFETIDLRDLNYTTIYTRVNMTDGGADSTPRMYQLRLIMFGVGVSGVTDVKVYPLFLYGTIAFLGMCMFVVLSKSKR